MPWTLKRYAVYYVYLYLYLCVVLQVVYCNPNHHHQHQFNEINVRVVSMLHLGVYGVNVLWLDALTNAKPTYCGTN